MGGFAKCTSRYNEKDSMMKKNPPFRVYNCRYTTTELLSRLLACIRNYTITTITKIRKKKKKTNRTKIQWENILT